MSKKDKLKLETFESGSSLQKFENKCFLFRHAERKPIIRVAHGKFSTIKRFLTKNKNKVIEKIINGNFMFKMAI